MVEMAVFWLGVKVKGVSNGGGGGVSSVNFRYFRLPITVCKALKGVV